MNLKTFNYIINKTSDTVSNIKFRDIINVSPVDDYESPIDNYLEKIENLNKILFDTNGLNSKLEEFKLSGELNETLFTKLQSYISEPLNVKNEHYNLLLLAHISAVESYFRELIRKVINFDMISFNHCSEKQVTYNAAYHVDKHFLPESLLEYKAFISKDDIKENLKEFLNINKNLVDSISVLNDFSKVCELRHCVVHRFSKIGHKNLFKLNMHSETQLVEKVISIDYDSFQDIINTCYRTVTQINTSIFNFLLLRLVVVDTTSFKKNPNPVWTWNWRKDKSLFMNYFTTFVSRKDYPDLNPEDIYKNYKNEYENP